MCSGWQFEMREAATAGALLPSILISSVVSKQWKLVISVFMCAYSKVLSIYIIFRRSWVFPHAVGCVSAARNLWLMLLLNLLVRRELTQLLYCASNRSSLSHCRKYCSFCLVLVVGRLKGEDCSLIYELAATCHWPTSTQTTRVNSHIWLCTVDNTVSVVLLLFIIHVFYRLLEDTRSLGYHELRPSVGPVLSQ